MRARGLALVVLGLLALAVCAEEERAGKAEREESEKGEKGGDTGANEEAAEGEGAAGGVERIATLEHEPLREVSGLTRSVEHDVWWVHNDSGDVARIFAIDAEGRVVFPSRLEEKYRGEEADGDDDPREPWPGLTVENATNVDWEEIALIGDELWIADTGNNKNARRDLGLYVLDEPDPRRTDRTRALRFLPIAYPDQKEFPAKRWEFDCEAIFGSEGKLYLLTKHRVGHTAIPRRGTKLYRLDTEHTDRENVLKLIGRHEAIGPPTACSLSPDGRKLAVLALVEVWVFERPAEGDDWLSAPARKIALSVGQTKQAEAICWDDAETLRIANEQRGVFRLKLSALKPVPK